MKYIDAELLETELKRRIKERDNMMKLGTYFSTSYAYEDILDLIDSLQQKQAENVELKEFVEKMDAWKARFNSPDDIPIKATMAFTARMFYMYPNVARQWYEQLPKTTMD